MFKLFVFLIILLNSVYSPAFAELNDSPLVNLTQQQLVAEQTRSDLLKRKLQGLRNEQKAPSPVISQQSVEHLDLLIAMSRADLESINLSLTDEIFSSQS